jgi:hypothetical protein
VVSFVTVALGAKFGRPLRGTQARSRHQVRQSLCELVRRRSDVGGADLRQSLLLRRQGSAFRTGRRADSDSLATPLDRVGTACSAASHELIKVGGNSRRSTPLVPWPINRRSAAVRHS